MGWPEQCSSGFRLSRSESFLFGDISFWSGTFDDSCLQLETLNEVTLMGTMAIACWTVALGSSFSNLYIKRFGSRTLISIYNEYRHYPNTFSCPTLCGWTAVHTSCNSSHPIFSCAVYASKSFQPILTPQICQLLA